MLTSRVSSIAMLAVLLAAGQSLAQSASLPSDPSRPRPDSGTGNPTYTLDEVVITIPSMDAPLLIETDPRAPRLPIPAADGAGYLKTIPGFAMTRKGGSGGDPVLRGLGASRISLQMNGIPLLGGCPGRMDPSTSYIFPESYDSLVVIKGPQSVRYGLNTTGTVRFVRETPRFSEPGVRGTASVLGGNAGRNDQFLDVTTGSKEGYLRTVVTRSHGSDYHDGNGDRVRGSYNRYSLTGIAGLTPDPDTVLEASADVSRAWAAYAHSMMDGSAFDRQGFRLKGEKKRLSEVLERVQLEGYYNNIDHIMDNYTLRPVTMGGMGMGAASSNPTRTALGGKAEADLRWGATQLTVGVDYSHDKHETRGLSAAEIAAGTLLSSKSYTPDMTFEVFGVFAEGRHDLDSRNRVLGGIRNNFVAVKNEAVTPNISDDDTAYMGFLRYEHDLASAPVTLYAGIGHVKRTADWWERNRVFTIDPEYVTQLDAGAIYTQGAWQLSASVFAATIKDYILIQSTAPTARNIDARMAGGELGVAYAVTRHWTARGTLAGTWGQNQTDDTALGQIPPLSTTLGINYDDGQFLGGVLMRAAAAQNRYAIGQGNVIGTDLGPTGAFAVFSADVGWRPRENMLLLAGVDNLFDTAYAEHISRGTSPTLAALGYAQTLRVNEPGRTFWLKGIVNF